MAGTTTMVEVRRVSQGSVVGAISIIVGGITADACALPGQAQDNPSDGRSRLFAEHSQNIKATAALVTKRRPTPPKKSGSSLASPLQSIKQKYPRPADRARLHNASWDLHTVAPNTIMPRYGKHRILTEGEINAVVTYLEIL